MFINKGIFIYPIFFKYALPMALPKQGLDTTTYT